MTDFHFSLRFSPDKIPALASKYNPKDDLEVEQIGKTAQERGFLLKPEFLKICAWKSPRTKPHVEKNEASLVEEITRIAFSNPFEDIRIGILPLLQGVQFPTASAILHLTHKDRYPILDFRALWSLGIDPLPNDYTVSFWNNYTKKCRKLADQTKLSMRTVDRALWQ